MYNTIQNTVVPVVAQDYSLEVRVVNGGSAKGCTAVLECVVPTFMKDLVKVVSWLQEPGFFIYPSLQGGKPIDFAKHTRTRIDAIPQFMELLLLVIIHNY